MKPPDHEIALQWLDQARSDFEALAPLCEAGKHDLVCFLAQQTAPKRP